MLLFQQATSKNLIETSGLSAFSKDSSYLPRVTLLLSGLSVGRSVPKALSLKGVRCPRSERRHTSHTLMVVQPCFAFTIHRQWNRSSVRP